jgi:hypothetical protein
VESAIHQIEFHRKEVTNTPYPYGIKLLIGVSASWLHGGDPERILQLDAISAVSGRSWPMAGFWKKNPDLISGQSPPGPFHPGSGPDHGRKGEPAGGC